MSKRKTKKIKHDLPEYLFVSRRAEGIDSSWLSASEDQINEIEGDGPTVVGNYKLMTVNRLSKHIHFEDV